ncbi:CBM96 family carbohydrate-binding protein [Actinomadura sp. WAC 06369]|uniref:CBM96 family carbohydrate-binding protein n=1 Tax=Actinomadura sp. WAC 06369 TaxID=2203193 RepID=UPI000F7AAD20|nr:DNRLRE domain-containing protein [Actinomadura sp. WAC 06369]
MTGWERRGETPPSFGRPAGPDGRPPRNRRARRAAAARARSRSRTRRRALRVTALGAVLAAAAGAGVVLAPGDLYRTAPVDGSERITVVPASADTYVSREEPDSVRGAHAVVSAAAWPDWHTEGYLAFTVPSTAAPFRSARLELTLERFDHLPADVELRALPGGWSEHETSWRNRPHAGRPLARVPLPRPDAPGGPDERVTVDVSRWIDGPGDYAFALVNAQRHTSARFRAGETAAGPRLVLSPDAPAAAPAPTASTAPSPSPSAPEASPPQARDAAPAPAPSSRKPDASGGGGGGGSRTDARTLCGVSLEVDRGQTHLEALAEAERRYGRLDMVRQFYPGTPGAWPGRFGDKLGKRPTVVSFKMNPRDVLAGKHDAKMARWFAEAPDDRDVYWVYYHEPEDNIADGHFTAADYRAAWRRLAGLADRADNPRLKATLVLMSWSLEPESRRNWRDYYPGRDVIDVLGWDTYNLAKSRYQTPDEMYGKVLEVSAQEDLPFGVAETGAHLIPGDDGAKRAAWLRSMTRYLEQKNALWVAYFDLDWPTGDFRLLDAPSIKAWNDFC